MRITIKSGQYASSILVTWKPSQLEYRGLGTIRVATQVDSFRLCQLIWGRD